MKISNFQNATYCQVVPWNICYIASYSLIIHHFSQGLQSTLHTFINYVTIYPDLHKNLKEYLLDIGIDEHNNTLNTQIGNHFNNPTINQGRRGTEFLQFLHLKQLSGNKYCIIIDFEFGLEKLPPESIAKLKNTLIENPGFLAQIGYSSGLNLWHSVVTGYDEIKHQFFIRDPYVREIKEGVNLDDYEINEFLIYKPLQRK